MIVINTIAKKWIKYMLWALFHYFAFLLDRYSISHPFDAKTHTIPSLEFSTHWHDIQIALFIFWNLWAWLFASICMSTQIQSATSQNWAYMNYFRVKPLHWKNQTKSDFRINWTVTIFHAYILTTPQRFSLHSLLKNNHTCWVSLKPLQKLEGIILFAFDKPQITYN
jgi:hypothetical protein